MSPLYDKLRIADDVDRREIAESLVAGMHGGRESANIDYAMLVRSVLLSEFQYNQGALATEDEGEFHAEEGIELLLYPDKINGYVRAIHDAASAATIIDAGTGPGAIMAVAAAVMHDSKVDAYELNPTAALCAERIAELLGLNGVIRVLNRNVLTSDLGRFGLGITETFGQAIAGGIQGERGAEIVAKLATCCEVVIPSLARVFAREFPVDKYDQPGSAWQPTTWIDMRQPHDYVDGYLISGADGTRKISVYASLHTADKTAVVTRKPGDTTNMDPILMSMELGTVEARVGDVLGFRYHIAASTRHKPPEVWNQTTGVVGESSKTSTFVSGKVTREL